MTNRVFAALVAAVVMMAPVVAAGQAPAGWTAPQTPDGQPDLQGVWASDSATPLERPAPLAGREYLIDEEVALLRQKAAELFNGETDAAFGDSVYQAVLNEAKDFESTDTTGNYNQFWLIDRWFENRTSLIVDPPDGRIPPLTAEAQARRETAPARRNGACGAELPRGHEDLGGMRCLGRGVPMTGRGYNSNYQIVQTEGHVVILMEMMHDTRIIPLDGRPRLSSDIRSALGDSRGHWEGDTLIVETTNLKAGRRGASSHLRLTERFTRVADDILQYEYTMDDATTWEQPWTARVFMRSAPGTGAVYEFACHEGNYSLANTLRGARALELAESR